MAAPRRLRRGNAFQEIVQADFIANSKGGAVEREFHIDFGPGSGRSSSGKKMTGRIDIWIDDLVNGAIAVFEIKATDWDLIAPGNVRRNIYRHQKQLLDYVYKYSLLDDLQVTYGLIYPHPPQKEGLRERIEHLAMTAYSAAVYWYTELNPEFDPIQLTRSLEFRSPQSGVKEVPSAPSTLQPNRWRPSRVSLAETASLRTLTHCGERCEDHLGGW